MSRGRTSSRVLSLVVDRRKRLSRSGLSRGLTESGSSCVSGSSDVADSAWDGAVASGSLEKEIGGTL